MDYIFQNNLRLYFVMPFVSGGELFKIVQSKGRLSEKLIAFYSCQIALAMGYLHERKIAHRDIKLDNILVENDGYIKIIDFGLSKTIGPNSVAKTTCGTSDYMAPEIFEDQPHSFTVDWWALGVCIYTMAIGTFPFTGAN